MENIIYSISRVTADGSKKHCHVSRTDGAASIPHGDVMAYYQVGEDERSYQAKHMTLAEAIRLCHERLSLPTDREAIAIRATAFEAADPIEQCRMELDNLQRLPLHMKFETAAAPIRARLSKLIEERDGGKTS